MISIQALFEETEAHGMHKKRLKKVSKVCNRLGDAEKLIPKMNFPQPGSERFNDDIQEVERCVKSPCLAGNFLENSDSSVEDIFRDFVASENKDYFNWKEVSKLLDEVDAIVLRLKFRYNRKRPKQYLVDRSEFYDDIRESKTPSFPSGHTAIAYFLAGVLSKNIPELEGEFSTLAELIGQSRIENGVHFPTDVVYGRLVGEMLSDSYNGNNNLKSIDKLENFHFRECSNYFRKLAQDLRPSFHREDALESYAEDLAQFIHRTNQIEKYHLNFNDCLNAASEFLMGYPTRYISENSHIKSTLDSIVCSYFLSDINTPEKVIQVHKMFSPDVLERGSPGEIRSFPHGSPTGTKYSEPKDIHDNLKACLSVKNRPAIKHIFYEWVHPFPDGNGRSGRIILASDLLYNFDIVNQIIDENYFNMLINFMNNNDVEEILSDI